MITLLSANDWSVRAENTIRKAGYQSFPASLVYCLINDALTGKFHCGAKTLEEFAAFEVKYFGNNETPIECIKYHMRVLPSLYGETILGFFVEYYSKR